MKNINANRKTSLLGILTTYPGFISSQASNLLALGASGPRRTLPVSV